MGKNKASQNEQTFASKSTQSILKKRRKDDKKLNISKNVFKKPHKMLKNISNEQNNSKKRKKQESATVLAIRNTKRPDPVKCLKKDKFWEVSSSQKTQANMDNKTKHRKQNKKQKRNVKRPDLIKCPERDNEFSKVLSSKKVQANTDNEIKHKKRKGDVNVKRPDSIKHLKRGDNESLKVLLSQKVQTTRSNKTKRRKQGNVNTSRTNNSLTKTDASVVKIKKSQTSAKETIDKLSLLKKVKQISTNQEVQQKPKKLLKSNCKIKIKRLQEMLANKMQTKQIVHKVKKKQPLTLKDRMMAHLRASRFRFINETLYNNKSSQSKQYFKEDPDAFKAYHDGYKQQLEQWPVNPLNVIISSIKKMPKDNVIADFGCGDAQLAASVPQEVHSFDFIALNNKVKVSDMAHTPLLRNSVDVVVFCLSLMGTNLNDYLIEANRVLKNDGILKIAEVESRFEKVEDFIKTINRYGFRNTWKNFSHDLFYFMDFKKEAEITKKKNLPLITLKSCLYKKR